jgi:hypothetical protein
MNHKGTGEEEKAQREIQQYSDSDLLGVSRFYLVEKAFEPAVGDEDSQESIFLFAFPCASCVPWLKKMGTTDHTEHTDAEQHRPSSLTDWITSDPLVVGQLSPIGLRSNPFGAAH